MEHETLTILREAAAQGNPLAQLMLADYETHGRPPYVEWLNQLLAAFVARTTKLENWHLETIDAD